MQHPPGWCDGSHIPPECPPHTVLLVEEETEWMKPISVWGMMRRSWWTNGPMDKFGDMGLHPYSFSNEHHGILMTTESQDLSLTSHPKDGAFYSIVSPSLHWGVRTHTQTTGWAPPSGLTYTSSSSNLVFPGGLPSRYWPGSALLSFSGQPVLGHREIWLLDRYIKIDR